MFVDNDDISFKKTRKAIVGVVAQLLQSLRLEPCDRPVEACSILRLGRWKFAVGV